jgi:hypothetical protein
VGVTTAGARALNGSYFKWAVFPTFDCKSNVSKQVGEDDEKSVTSIAHH